MADRGGGKKLSQMNGYIKRQVPPPLPSSGPGCWGCGTYYQTLTWCLIVNTSTLTHTGMHTSTHRHTLSWAATASKKVLYYQYCVLFINIAIVICCICWLLLWSLFCFVFSTGVEMFRFFPLFLVTFSPTSLSFYFFYFIPQSCPIWL